MQPIKEIAEVNQQGQRFQVFAKLVQAYQKFN